MRRHTYVLLLVLAEITLSFPSEAKGKGKKPQKWLLEFESVKTRQNEVPIVEFQKDSIMSSSTVALLREPMPSFKSFSVCFWLSIYYWRAGNSIISYALDDERDNYFFLYQNEENIEVTVDQIHLVYKHRATVNFILRWKHICVIATDTVSVYINGHYIIPSEENYSHKVNTSGNDTKVLEGGGTFALGQDQDRPGGGYSVDSSLSGAVANFELFPTVLSMDDISALSKCQKVTSKPMLDLKDPAWEFNNVSLSTIPGETFCLQQKEGTYFIFNHPANYEESVSYCRSLGGFLPHEDNLLMLLNALKSYFNYRYMAFTKVHIHINITAVNKSKCYDLRVYWDPDRYIKAAINDLMCSSRLSAFICNVIEQKYIKMRGIPAKIKEKVDELYQLFPYQAVNQLRGVQKSYIGFKNMEWCLYSLGDANQSALLCYEAHSDFPPLGRKLWSNRFDNGTSLIVLTLCVEGEFTCDSGDCVKVRYRCDTIPHCLDKSDENNCKLLVQDEKQFGSIRSVPQTSLLINGSITVTNIPEINLDKNYFVTSMWINVSWRDDRIGFLNLAHLSETHIDELYFSYYMWTPNTLLNPVQGNLDPVITTGSVRRLCNGQPEICDTREENLFSAACSEVWIRRFYHIQWQCEFNLMKFPFEKVECQSLFLLENKHLWNKNVSVFLPLLTHLPYKVHKLAVESSESALILKLLFVRQAEGYFVTTFIPIFLLVVIGILTFFFESHDFTNRVMVTLSTLIVMASLFAQKASSLPNTSYTKCIDLVFLCTIFFLSLIFSCHVLLLLMLRRKNRIHVSIKPTNMYGQTSTGKVYLNIFFMPNFWVFCLCIASAFACLSVITNKCT